MTAVEYRPINSPCNNSDRRAFLKVLGAASALGLADYCLPPRQAFSQTPQDFVISDELAQSYRLRDLEKAYEIWKREQPDISAFPTFEKFSAAINLCRQACCSIYIVNHNQITASFSGFLIDIPSQHQTTNGHGKRFIVTCDHQRLIAPDGAARLVFSNGLNVSPSAQLVESFGQNGYPEKDLRIYVCQDNNELRRIPGLPIMKIKEVLAVNLAALTYEPLTCRMSTQINTASGNILRSGHDQSQNPRENFILTRVSNPKGYETGKTGPTSPDTNYPRNTGYLTAGQLNVGGSGSPNLIFDGDNFYVGGHQVAYVAEPENEDSYAGEIRNDGRIVHINNAIELLKTHRYWK